MRVVYKTVKYAPFRAMKYQYAPFRAMFLCVL